MNDSLLHWFGYKVGEVGLAGIKRKKGLKLNPKLGTFPLK